jgi:hypothetical protein
MDTQPHPEQLIEFPCDYMFKAFGPNDPDGVFLQAVRTAVSAVQPVPLDAIRMRASSGGKYLCVTVLVRLHSYEQLRAIYSALRLVADLKYLL